jgi:hypothetical protein
MTGIADQHDRILALLRLRDDREVRQSDPVPDAEDIGALDGLGLDWPGEEAHVSVYLFDGYAAAAEAQARLRGYAAEADLTAETTINGGLLLWAVAPSADERANERIRGLKSRFAGKE